MCIRAPTSSTASTRPTCRSGERCVLLRVLASEITRPARADWRRCGAMRVSTTKPGRETCRGARRGESVGDLRVGFRSACRPTRSWPMARATMRAGCTVSIAIAAIRHCWARRAARWAMACRRRLPRSFSIPSAIVVACAGDGCFLMNGQELATAVQYKRADHRPRVRQWHVRHHPHAPGTRISRRVSSAPTCRIRISSPWPKAYGALWHCVWTRTERVRTRLRRRVARKAAPRSSTSGRSRSDLAHDHADEVAGKREEAEGVDMSERGRLAAFFDI